MNTDSNNYPRPTGWPEGRRRKGLTAGALLLAGSLVGWTAADSVRTAAAAAPPAPAAAAAGAAARTIGAGGDS